MSTLTDKIVQELWASAVSEALTENIEPLPENAEAMRTFLLCVEEWAQQINLRLTEPLLRGLTCAVSVRTIQYCKMSNPPQMHLLLVKILQEWLGYDYPTAYILSAGLIDMTADLSEPEVSAVLQLLDTYFSHSPKHGDLT